MNTAMSENVIDMTVKPISPDPLSAASYGERPSSICRVMFLDLDDGVVDHESDRDGQSHQGEVVEAVAKLVEHREGADQRQRHGDGRDNGPPRSYAGI
jgi:hypothetical protein